MTTNQHPNVPDLDLVLSTEGYLTAQRPTAEGAHGFVARDGLTAARLLDPWRPDVTAATLKWAADWQGTKLDPMFDEEPGKIPHEVIPPGWWRQATYLGLPVPVRSDGWIVSYFSADATAEWLIALAVATARAPSLAANMEANWRAAGDYLLRRLAIGGGLLRWGPRAWPGTGLEAQAWRDEPNMFRATGGSILHPDGTPSRAPMADWETQASVLVALRGLHRLSGDPDHLQAALALEARINAGFVPNTLALDRFDDPVVGASSAAGVLLWAGALSSDRAKAAVERLLQPDLCTNAGIRTLADTEPQYDPIGTRRGRIYSYNSYLAACGLRAYGRVEQADRLATGMAEAIDALGDYPESWAVVHARNLPQRTGVVGSAWTIAVRHALRTGHFDTAAGLCEPLLRRI